MGFLHKLWDETLAGPAPETGLGKLRKCNSLSTEAEAAAALTPVSRSITMVRTRSEAVESPVSTPCSPMGSGTPRSPFSPTTPGGNFKKFTRRKPANHNPEWEHRTGYDWIVIQSALDH